MSNINFLQLSNSMQEVDALLDQFKYLEMSNEARSAVESLIMELKKVDSIQSQIENEFNNNSSLVEKLSNENIKLKKHLKDIEIDLDL